MKRILIVEDEPSIASFLASLFQGEDYELMLANNGEEALHRLAEKLPTVILSDVMMPLMDGLELCRTLQNNALYRAIPLILMSAVDHLVSQNECHHAAFIRKPFSWITLLDLINEVTGA